MRTEAARVFWYSFVQCYDCPPVKFETTAVIYEVVLFAAILVPNYVAFLNYLGQLPRFGFIKNYIYNVRHMVSPP